MIFIATLKKGNRSDTFEIHSSSETKVKKFLSLVSTSSLLYLKKIVYSKAHKINYYNTNYVDLKNDEELKVVCSSKSYAEELILRYPKKNLDKETIVKTVKDHLTLDGEEITNIITIAVTKTHEGFSPSLKD